jgi:hypothetical protein
MRLAEYYNLTPEEKKIQDEKAHLSLIASAKELDEKGIWSIPSDLKKRLKKGETINIWNSLSA